jgi:hypothetical protein
MELEADDAVGTIGELLLDAIVSRANRRRRAGPVVDK